MQRKILARLSEKEGNSIGWEEFAKEMNLNDNELERQLKLNQDDGYLEINTENSSFKEFVFRVTSSGYEFLQNTSQD